MVVEEIFSRILRASRRKKWSKKCRWAVPGAVAPNLCCKLAVEEDMIDTLWGTTSNTCGIQHQASSSQVFPNRHGVRSNLPEKEFQFRRKMLGPDKFFPLASIISRGSLYRLVTEKKGRVVTRFNTINL